jgi:hypothetical protein
MPARAIKLTVLFLFSRSIVLIRSFLSLAVWRVPCAPKLICAVQTCCLVLGASSQLAILTYTSPTAKASCMCRAPVCLKHHALVRLAYTGIRINTRLFHAGITCLDQLRYSRSTEVKLCELGWLSRSWLLCSNSAALIAVGADEQLRLPGSAGKLASEQKQLYAKDLEGRLR